MAIPWLGNYCGPSVAVKRSYELLLGKMIQPVAEPGDLEVEYLNSASVQWHGVEANSDKTMWASSAEIRNLAIRSGDLLICEGGDAGRAAIYDGPPGRIFQNSLHRARSLQGSDIRYLKYLLTALHGSGWPDILCNKATIAHLTVEKLGSIEIPWIPVAEQRRIANFLDAETSRIDRLISAQLRVLDLLEERANSRILELIGQNLLVRRDGAATVPMRRVIKKLSRHVIATDEVITAFRDGQVTSRNVRRSEGYTLAASAEPQGQGVEAGDIVVHGLDGFAGAIGDSEASGNCSPVYHVCTPIDGGNSAFYGRLLRLLALSDYLALFGASARERAVDFRNWQIFGHAPIPKVKPREQQEIGGLITKIRPLREEVRRFNERIAERRQALITAAVTGQMDVTTIGGVAV